MRLLYRRLIYLLLIIVFLVITPVLILYTAGYRYNFQKNKIQKTGIIILKSKPEGAEIYLNEKLQKTKTPARIPNLMPENYHIKVEKDGFYSWEKNLPVKSRLTTFAEDIILFKKNLSMETISGEITALALSPDKGKIAYLINKEGNNEIWLLELKTSKNNFIYGGSGNAWTFDLGLEWSHDGQKIIIYSADEKLEKKYIVFDHKTGGVSTYEDLNEFYFDFIGIKKTSLNFIPMEDFIFRPGSSGLIAVLSKKNGDLKILNANSEEIIFETKADDIEWSRDGKKLLYLKNFEIWFYDTVSDQETLITRYSKEIGRAAWINDNYILILFENSLKAIELDERDQRNVSSLASLDHIKDFNLDTTNKKIYFIGYVGNQKGIFELSY